MSDTANLVLGVDSRQVATGAKSLDDLAVAGGRAENSTNALTKATSVLANAAKYAASAFGLYKLAQYAQEATMLAARHETMGIVMKVAGNNAGYAASEMAKYSKELQKNGISMLQSRDALTQLATAHIDLSKAALIGRAAQDLAVVGNINSSEAMARMIHGIKSGQIETLRTLGLNVSFEKSYKSMAAQLGINVTALTEQQKTLARTNAVLLESKNYAGIYEESMTTAGKAMSSLTRYSENLKIKIGDIFLPALADAVFQYTDALKAANAEMDKLGSAGTVRNIGESLAGAFRTVYETVVVLAANVGYVFTTIGNEIGGIAAQAAAILSGDFVQAGQIRKDMLRDAEAGRKAIDAFTERMLSHGDATKKVSQYSEEAAIKRAAEAKAQIEAEEKKAAAAKGSTEKTTKYNSEMSAKLADIEKDRLYAAFAADKAGRIAHSQWQLTMELGRIKDTALAEKEANQETANDAIREHLRRGDASVEINGEYVKQQEALVKADEARWKMIDGFAHTAFDNIFDKGKNAFEEIGKVIKKSILDMLYKMTIQKWIFSIGVTSAGVGASSMASAAGLGNYGGGTGLMDIASSGLGMAMSGLTATQSLAAASAYGSAALSATSLAEGISMATSGLSLAMPYIGAAIAAVSLISSLFESKPQSTPLGTSQGIFTSTGERLSSNVPEYRTQMSESSVIGMQQQYAAIADALEIAKAATSFYTGIGLHADKSGIFGSVGGGAGDKYYSSGNVASDAEVQLAASRAVFAALQGSELPGHLSKMFDGLTAGSMTQADIDNTLAFAGSVKQMRDALLETRAPLEVLRANVNAGTEAFATSAATFRNDFVAAIDAGISPQVFDQWKSLGTAIDQLAAADAEVAANRIQLEIKIMELSGDAIGALAAQRQIELDAMDAALRPLQQNIYAMEDMASSAAKLEAALQAAADAQDKLANAHTRLLTAQGDPVGSAEASVGYAQIAYDAALGSLGTSFGVSLAETMAFVGRDLIGAYESMSAAGHVFTTEQQILVAAAGEALAGLLNAETALAAARIDAATVIEDVVTAIDTSAELARINLGWQQQINVLTGEQTQRQVDLENALTGADASTALLINELFGLQDAAKLAADAAALAKTNLGWQQQIDVLQGTQTQRQVDLANALEGADDSTALLINQLFELQDAATAAADATQKLADIESLRNSIASAYQSFVDKANSTAAAVLSEQQAITDGYLAAQDEVASAQEAITSINEQAAKEMKNFADNIREFVNTIRTTDLGGLNKSAQFSALMAEFAITTAQAKAGDTTALGDITGQAQMLLDVKQVTATSAFEYARFAAQIAGTLDEVATLADGRAGPLAVAVDPMVKALDDLAVAQADVVKWQRAVAVSGASTVKAVADYAADWRVAVAANDIAQADLLAAISATGDIDMQQLTELQKLNGLIAQYLAAGGVKSATVTPAVLTASLASNTTYAANNAAAGVTNQTQIAANNRMYGLSDTWNNAGGSIAENIQTVLAAGYTKTDLLNSFRNAPFEAMIQALPGLAVGTNEVPFDMVANIHAGEEIKPKQYVDKDKSARDETNALLRRLTASNDEMKKELTAIKKSNEKMWQIDDKHDIEGMPAVRAA